MEITRPHRTIRDRGDGFYLGSSGEPTSPEQGLPSALGDPDDELVIYVNGLGVNVDRQLEQMKLLSKNGHRVVGVHNATDGLVNDVIQTLCDKISVGDNPAVDTVKQLIRHSMKSGLKLSLLGHSQGALICSRALAEYKKEINSEGKSLEELNKNLSDVRLETLAGAAFHYPEGPKYLHRVNLLDPVTWVSGQAIPSFWSSDTENSSILTFARAIPRQPDPNKHPFLRTLGALFPMVHNLSVYFGESKPC